MIRGMSDHGDKEELTALEKWFFATTHCAGCRRVRLSLFSTRCARCRRELARRKAKLVSAAAGECLDALKELGPAPQPALRKPAPAKAAAAKPVATAAGKNFIICPNPNCGYRGEGLAVRERDLVAGIILLLFAIIPGVLYLLLCCKIKIICPKCMMPVR